MIPRGLPRGGSPGINNALAAYKKLPEVPDMVKDIGKAAKGLADAIGQATGGMVIDHLMDYHYRRMFGDIDRLTSLPSEMNQGDHIPSIDDVTNPFIMNAAARQVSAQTPSFT